MGTQGSVGRAFRGAGLLGLGLVAGGWASGETPFAARYSGGLLLARVQSESSPDLGGSGRSFGTTGFTCFLDARTADRWGGVFEFGYLGRFPAEPPGGTVGWSRDVRALGIAGQGWFPLGRGAALFGRAGLTAWFASARNLSSGWLTVTDGRDASRSGVSPVLGMGLDLDLGRSWMLRIEGQVLPRVLEARVTRVGVGIAFFF